MTDRVSEAIARYHEPVPEFALSQTAWWLGVKHVGDKRKPRPCTDPEIAMRLLKELLVGGWMIDGVGLFSNERGNVKFVESGVMTFEEAIALAYCRSKGISVDGNKED